MPAEVPAIVNEDLMTIVTDLPPADRSTAPADILRSLLASSSLPTNDPRDALMLGRTIKTTRITVLRAEPSKGQDWWLCRCSCGREFVAHGWDVRHGRTRNCGEHGKQPQDVAEQSQRNISQQAQSGEQGILAWFDGACEPLNPGGTASFGVIVKGEDGTVLLRDHRVVGKSKAMSNNLAEYAGVLHILKHLASRRPGRVTIHGDSNLVINQLSGKWRVRKGLYLSIAVETKELLAHLRGLGWQINFCWIPREQNEECDRLSKKKADKPDSTERFNDCQDNQDHQNNRTQEGFIQGVVPGAHPDDRVVESSFPMTGM
jgi:ribonuclease HI